MYDLFGNVIQKTISAPRVTARTIADKYDINGRFVLEKTDHELFVCKYEYNPLGQVTKTTNYLDVISSVNYDNWGKIVQNSVAGASSATQTSTLGYNRFTDGGFAVTTTNSTTNEITRSFQDVLGRNIKSTTKGFNINSWISKATEYDFLGRKTRESGPYADSNPTLPLGNGTKWNSVTYDYLSRTVGQLSYNGKTQSISYTGLSSTTIDGPKTVKVTVDANGNKTELVDNSETLTYTYYANGTPRETIYGNHKITTKFDGWGRQIYMLDPSVSTTPYTSTFNNYGELLTDVTPTGITTITYSPAGRITKKTSIGQNTNLENNFVYNSKGMLTGETGTTNGKTFTYLYEFNSIWQLITKTEVTLDNLTHLKAFTYDGQGRTLQERTHSYLTNNTTVHNGNNTIEYGYNSYNGILDQFKEVPTNVVLWKLNSANEKMQALSASLGNGIQITNTYDANDYVNTINHTHSAGVNVALNLEYQFKGNRGTLDYRKNTIAGVLSWNEIFTYDSFERLTSWTDQTGTATNTYETDGRINTNNLVGTYAYDTANRYRKISAGLNANGFALYATRSPQTIASNMFKNPISVIEVSRGRVNFEFNLGNSRSKSNVMTEAGAVAKNKYYSGVSAVEVIEKPNQTFQFITYIAGSPYDAVVALEKTYTVSGATYTASTEEFVYLHRDYQGSILAISGNGGAIKERRQFDPWGVLKKYYKNNLEISPSTFTNVDFELLTDRGYTGHEHFFSVGIIHMNGRIYDPVLRTFLSADPLISRPNDSQNYNRYAYAMNNPLLYVDYNGYEPVTLAIIATAALYGALIAGASYTILSLYNGNFTWGGLAKNILVGAVVGAAGGYLAHFAPVGILPGAGYGAITGAVTNVLSSAFSGEDITFKGVIVGAITGGVIGGIAGGIQAHNSGADIWSGIKTDVYTLEDFNKLNITETNTKLKYSDATLNKMYKENFQGPVSKMAGGNDKLALKSMTTNTSGGTAQYSGSADGTLWVKVDGKMTKGVLAATKMNPFGKSSNVVFSRAAFESTERLATVMAHELGHVTHNFLGLSALAHVKWESPYIGDDVDNVGHAAIYRMQLNFTKTNGFIFDANIPALNIGLLNTFKSHYGSLGTEIEYLSKIKIR